ncbi:lipopolysaccharide ABC transporter, membrane protein LptF [Citrifermentans bemidjiense Bem]|uniref:Lipopolysaccharide ABC transporter, membrane protein LptF n=1 Tax=Citrifermentans bemidjiense (strain ATCC BAA-1014 / DSM 16622 / JCM 12645 / Bem) TaxID=404380 RepID=B5EBA8_CITBB|nr:LPS export ABC transporter permease LptF [Citrifermentans bemidjiense]ACH40400.1 lipopolysaccharide ABC transporter, membrane protein LptF [Citrifermentans bemidjiense Bem]
MPNFMKKTLYAYIFKEIPTPFLVGMVTFTFVLLMGRFLKLAEMVVEKGIPFSDVVRMVAYLLPPFWLFTIPMALLLAMLLAFGRLSGDSEITAMKSCGISLYGLLPPPMLFAACATLACLWVTVYAVPWGNSGFKKLMVEIAQSSAGIAIKEKIFNNAFPGMVVYTQSLDTKAQTMGGVIVHDERDPRTPTTIFASTGALVSDPKSNSMEFQLRNGSIHRAEEQGGYRMVQFQEYNLRVALADGSNKATRKVSEMTLDELLHPPKGTQQKEIISRDLEYHSRLALPFSCFVFTLLAIPLGIQNRRSGKAAGFSLSIGVILLYYVTLSAFDTLGERGTLPPLLAGWSPNLIFLLAGAYLFKKTSDEERLPIFSLYPRLKEALRGRLSKGRKR